MAVSKAEGPPPLALALVAAIALLAHARGLDAGFVFDDRGAILENPVVQGDLDLGAILGTDFWGRAPGEGPGTHRPLVVLSFWLNQHVVGSGFHGTNLLLHAATAVALTLALARQTKQRALAVVAGMVFGALAVNTEAVVGIVGRADVMAAGLCFLAWFLLGHVDERMRPRELWGPALAFAGALASKESAIVLPLLVVLADRALASPGRAPKLVSPRYLSLAGAAVAMILLRLAVFASPSSVARDAQANPLVDAGLGSTIWTSLRLFGKALGLIAWPVGLSADYSYAAILPERSPLSLGVVLGAIALAALVVAAVRARRREPIVALAVILLLVPWVAISHVPFALPTIFAERLLYMPAAGFALFVAWVVTWVIERTNATSADPSGPRKGGKKRAVRGRRGASTLWDPTRARWAALVLAPVLLGNAALAWGRAADWKDERSLFEAAIAVVPSSARAHHNYGTSLLNGGQAVRAIGPLLRASEILPSWAEPHAQLGVALLEAGRAREAESHFRKAVELDPTSPKAVFNLAVFLAREGRLVDARDTLAPFVARFPGRTREAELLRKLEADVGASGSVPPR